MKKSVILLSGTPEEKSRFIDIAMGISWVWNVSFKNQLTSLSKSFTDSERDEKYHKFISEFRELTNKYWKAEEKYLKENIEKFNRDSDVEKISPDGRRFDTFILIMHGVSPNLVEMLKDEYGVFTVRVSKKSLNSNEHFSDLVLYGDEPDFEDKVKNLICVLTKN